jgi:hypothetical protein
MASWSIDTDGTYEVKFSNGFGACIWIPDGPGSIMHVSANECRDVIEVPTDELDAFIAGLRYMAKRAKIKTT